jgi:hypothetical protein
MIRGIYRMTASQFRKAIDAGVFGERHVDLNRRLVEVRTLPSGKGKQAGYGRCEVDQCGDHIPVVLDGQEVGKIAVAAILP